jgi:RNA polymerase sigma-70 factor (ECF subfamily)
VPGSILDVAYGTNVAVWVAWMIDRQEQVLDELLVLRCREGSAPAFRALVSRWQPRLWKYAFRLTGREDAASDVMQEAWSSVARSIASLVDTSRFRPWIYRLVTLKAADWQRRRQRDERRTAHGIDPEDIDSLEEGDNDPLEQMERDERVSRLRDALRWLPGEWQAILWLHFVEGFTNPVLAAILNIPVGTVKSRLHHATQELKRLLTRSPS